MRPTIIVTLLILIGFIAPAAATHDEPHPSGWFDYQYNEFDDAVLYCDARNYLTLVPNGIYLHDRPGPDSSSGTGLASENGGGTWLFEETNGVPGLQIGGGTLAGATYEALGLEGGFEFDDRFTDECPNGDTLLGGSALGFV